MMFLPPFSISVFVFLFSFYIVKCLFFFFISYLVIMDWDLCWIGLVCFESIDFCFMLIKLLLLSLLCGLV